MPVATLVDQPEHRQGMNDIEMNNIEKEGDVAEDDHGLGKTISKRLNRRKKHQRRADGHQ